ncbi:MAG: LptA/OstA family protein, partial [Candidatus Muiribacteriota bacterium]
MSFLNKFLKNIFITDKNKNLKFFQILILLFVFKINSLSLEIPKVVIYGGVVDYKIDEEMVYVRDNAHIFYDEFEVFADSIQIDIKNDKVFAVGNVVLWQGTDKTTGEYLEYSNKTGSGYVEDGVLVRNESFMYADKIELGVRKITAENVIWTTCDLDHPHYYMEAKKIDIYPDEVMWARDMRYVIMGHTLIKQKHYKVDIKPVNEVFRHRYGYSKSRGLWFNLVYTYLATEAAKGSLTYDHSTRGSKSLATSNSFVTSQKYNGRMTLNSTHYFSADKSSSTHSFNLNNRSNIRDGSLNVTTNLFARKYDTGTDTTDLDYNVSLTRKLPSNLLSLSSMTVYWNEKKRLKGPGNMRVFDKIPEVNFTSSRFDVLNNHLKVNYSLLLGKYFEGGTDNVDATKEELKINYSSQTYVIPYFGRLNLTGNIQNMQDSKGNDRKQYFNGLSLNNTFRKKTQISMKWDRRDSFGQSAFSYYNREKSSIFRNTITHNENNFRFTVFSYNYDLIKGEFMSNAYSDMRYTDNKFEFYTKADIDMKTMSHSDFFSGEKFEIISIYNRISYNFDRSSYLRLTLPYDRATGKITSVYKEFSSNLSDLKIGKMFLELSRVNLRVNWRKDLISSETKALNFEAKIDLHCWEALIKWDRNRKEGWLEFYVKAFSDKKHRVQYDAESGRIRPILNRVNT